MIDSTDLDRVPGMKNNLVQVIFLIKVISLWKLSFYECDVLGQVTFSDEPAQLFRMFILRFKSDCLDEQVRLSYLSDCLDGQFRLS